MFGSNIQPNRLLAIRRAALTQQNFEIGFLGRNFTVEEINAYVAARWLAYNQQMNDFLGRWCQFTTEPEQPQVIGAQDGDFHREAEGGTILASRSSVTEYLSGVNMYAFVKQIQFTREALMLSTLNDFNYEINAIENGDRRNVFGSLIRAIFNPTQATERDAIDGRTLTIYPLANGDSRVYPVSWNGSPVTNPHNHYLGRVGGSIAASDLDIAAAHIWEHKGGTSVSHYVSFASSGAISSLPGFTAAVSELITPGVNTATPNIPVARQQDETSLDPIPIGVLNNRVVYKWWWIPDNYILTMSNADVESIPGRTKPLLYRVPRAPYYTSQIGSRLPLAPSLNGVSVPGKGQLEVVRSNQDSDSIFSIEKARREFGVAINNPLSMVITYMGGTSYVQPTITLA